MKHLKEYSPNDSRINEGFWETLFGKPSIENATHDSMRAKGFSHRGKEDDLNYIMFNGQKFYPDQIVYDDYNSTKKIPRIESGKLIVANPAWSL